MGVEREASRGEGAGCPPAYLLPTPFPTLHPVPPPTPPLRRKRKLEELVTKHLGKARDVSDEDIKSSVLHGAGGGGGCRGQEGHGQWMG